MKKEDIYLGDWPRLLLGGSSAPLPAGSFYPHAGHLCVPAVYPALAETHEWPADHYGTVRYADARGDCFGFHAIARPRHPGGRFPAVMRTQLSTGYQLPGHMEQPLRKDHPRQGGDAGERRRAATGGDEGVPDLASAGLRATAQSKDL
jgi:hypothetical protein